MKKIIIKSIVLLALSGCLLVDAKHDRILIGESTIESINQKINTQGSSADYKVSYSDRGSGTTKEGYINPQDYLDLTNINNKNLNTDKRFFTLSVDEPSVLSDSPIIETIEDEYFVNFRAYANSNNSKLNKERFYNSLKEFLCSETFLGMVAVGGVSAIVIKLLLIDSNDSSENKHIQ